MLNQHLATLNFRTPGRGLLEITSEVRSSVAASGIREGLLTLFLRHTSASLLIHRLRGHSHEIVVHAIGQSAP